MNQVKGLRKQLRLSLTTIVLLALITLVIGSYILTQNIANDISVRNASLHGNDLASRISSHLSADIRLAINHAKSPQIIKWYKNEDDPTLKEEAVKELGLYIDSYYDNNVFVAIEESNHFYLVEEIEDLEGFKPVGLLDENVLEDNWFFYTMEMDATYNLNVDVDRFLDTLRVWVNVKVEDDQEVIGAIGTGLLFGPFIEEIFKEEMDEGATSFLIDGNGHVQVAEDVTRIQQNSFDNTGSIEKTIYGYFEQTSSEQVIKEYIGERDQRLVHKLKNESYDYMVIAPLEIADWYVVTLYDNDSLFDSKTFVPLFVLMILLAIIIVVAMERIVYTRVFMPHEQLIRSVVERDVHESEALYGSERKDEIGDLSRLMDLFLREIDRNTLVLEREAESIAKRLDRVFRRVPFGVFVYDEAFELVYLNPYIYDFLGVSKDNPIEDPSKIDLSSLGVSEDEFDEVKLQLSDIGYYNQEVELQSIDGESRWCQIEIRSISDEGKVTYEGILVNLQMQKAYEAKLIELTRIDELTGLYNRRYFRELVSKELMNVRRYKYPITMLMYDIDHFKVINDQYGHEIGDKILIGLSNVVKANIRSNDMLVRWGGEEFIIILPHTFEEEGIEIAEKLRAIIESHSFVNDIKVTSSFGVSEYRVNEEDNIWFDRVDSALLKAKRFGRNRVETYTSSLKNYNFDAYANNVYYKSGHPVIDQQHLMLFDTAIQMIEELFTSNIQHSMALYDEVETLTIEHYETEEAYLKEINFEGLGHHKEVHKKLLEDYRRYLKDFADRKITELELLSFVIEEMLVRHISTEDLQYMNIGKGDKK